MINNYKNCSQGNHTMKKTSSNESLTYETQNSTPNEIFVDMCPQYTNAPAQCNAKNIGHSDLPSGQLPQLIISYVAARHVRDIKFKYGPCHVKTCLRACRQWKLRSDCAFAVWSGPSLSANRIIRYYRMYNGEQRPGWHFAYLCRAIWICTFLCMFKCMFFAWRGPYES